MSAFEILQDRGFFYQLTDEQTIQDKLAAGPVTFYIGFDPTADSLHVGHLLPVMGARILQAAGHLPIMLVGGGTAMVGDPSGKTEMRQMLTTETIAANAEAIKGQLGRFLDFGDGKARMVNNLDWLGGIKYIEFLRDIGSRFSVNRMLQAESVKQRLDAESGLSFLEFNYMLLQAYDFYVLSRDHGCSMQFGGQDQWGNIVAGIDLARRMIQAETYGGTFPLLTNSQGQKFGKSVGGAVWLDETRTSVFDYYQFWRNVDDADVTKLLLLFTPLPADECRRLGALETPAVNRAKEILAYEATALAHGHEKAVAAYASAIRQFGAADDAGAIPTTSRIATITAESAADTLPTYTVPAADLADGLWICKLFADSGLAKSNGEARRLVKQGGGYLNDEKIEDDQLQITAADFAAGPLMLRAGKKNHRRILLGE